jgi:hypothetical protein
MEDSTSPDESHETSDAPFLAYHSASGGATSAMVWCRILSLFMLGWGLQSALVGSVQAIDYMQRQPVGGRFVALVLFGTLTPAVVWLLLAWFCWAKAPSLAERITRGLGENPGSSAAMSAGELLFTLIIGIGIYMVATGLPTVMALIFLVLEQARSGGQSDHGQTGAIAGAVARCLLGLWLILGPRGIVQIIRRYGGKWREPDGREG